MPTLPYLGFGATLGVGIQSAWNTAVARTLWFPIVSESLKRTVEKGKRNSLAASGGGRISNAHFISADNVGGSVTLLMTYEGFGVWWKHLLGAAAAPTGPVSGLYTHSFTHTLATLPGLTLEPVRGNGTAEVFDGMKPTKGSVKVEPGKEVTATFDFLGRTSGGRVAAGTPSIAASFGTVAIFDQAGVVNWNSGTYATVGFEITVDNKLARRPVVGSRLSAEPLPSGLTDVTIRLELEWNTDDFVTGFTADTAADLTVTFTDASGRSIAFELKNAYVEDVSDPVTGVGVIRQTVTLSAQSTSSNNGLTITVVNTQSTSLAA